MYLTSGVFLLEVLGLKITMLGILQKWDFLGTITVPFGDEAKEGESRHG
jgi:hypothetical protein